MNELISFIIAGLVILLIPILAIAYFQAGFFLKWFKVRGGRGKFVLIKIRSRLRDHFDYGSIQGDFLVYGKKKNQKRIVVPERCIYRSYGVDCIDIDESKNAVSRTDYEAVTGHDAEKFEDLYTRALYRPSLEENRDKVMLILLIICIAGLAIVALMCWNISQQISTIGGGTITQVL